MTKVTVGGGSSVHLRGTIKPGLEDVIEGTNVTIDKTDPKNPIISSTGGGGSMVYPGAGIPLSTGSAWGTSITDNSATWNTAITTTGTQALTGNKIVTGSGSNYNLALGDASLGELGAFTVLTSGSTSISSSTASTSSLNVGGYTGSLRNGPRGYEASPTGIFIFANAGQYIEGDVTGFKFVLGSDASQDLYKRDPSGYLVRIPLGSSGDVLTNVSGTVGWAAPSSSFTLVNGNGTTVNGTGDGVDLGGTQSANISIIPDGDFTRSFDFGDATHNLLGFNIWGDTYLKGYSEHTGVAQFNSSLWLDGDDSGLTSFDVRFKDAGLNATRISAQWSQAIIKHNSGRGFLFNNSGVQFTLGSDATGDIYYRNSSGYLTRLAAGTNGHVLTMGASVPGWAAPSGGGGLTVGTSTITSGTNTKVLYNNSGVLGEYTVSGTGNVALTTSPTFTTPALGTPSALVGTNITGTATGLTSGITNALKSATTTVDVSAATAPTSGQVLTATSGTAATWQTPASASGAWLLTGTSTLTGAVNVVGSATNKFKFTIPSLGTSVTDEFLIENNTAATSGNQQSSGLVLGGYGWKTTSTAASQSVKFQLLNTPVQGTTNPSGIFSIKSSINGAAYGTDLFNVDSNGNGTLAGALVLSGSVGGNRFISFSGGVGSIYSSGNAGLVLRANDGATVISGGAVRMWNIINFSATSGNQIHLGVEIPFAPTSGTATMTALNISGAINQTGGANGAIRGLYYNPTLTALGGTNRVIDATSGDINLDAGNAYIKGTGTGTGKGLTISDSGSNERFSVQHNGVINVNGSSGTAGYKLTSNGTSAPTWEAPSIKTSTTKTVAETIVRNMGTIGASSTSTSSIRVNADYGNSTTLIADITVYAIKSDGSASVMGKVTGRYRKNSSGTFSVDDAGTTVTSDVTILLSIVPEINGTNPQVQVNTGASAANYDFSFTAVCSYITY